MGTKEATGHRGEIKSQELQRQSRNDGSLFSNWDFFFHKSAEKWGLGLQIYCAWPFHVQISFLKLIVNELGCLIFQHFLNRQRSTQMKFSDFWQRHLDFTLFKKLINVHWLASVTDSLRVLQRGRHWQTPSNDQSMPQLMQKIRNKRWKLQLRRARSSEDCLQSSRLVLLNSIPFPLIAREWRKSWITFNMVNSKRARTSWQH